MKIGILLISFLFFVTLVSVAYSATITPCITDTSCTFGYKCNTNLGYCTPKCTSNTQCGSSGFCNTVSGYCEISCGSNSQCSIFSESICDTQKKACIKDCSCTAYFKTQDGRTTSSTNNLLIYNGDTVTLNAQPKCPGSYSFTLMESDGFSKSTIEVQPNDLITTLTPILSSGLYSSSWNSIMNPNSETLEGGIGEFYFIVKKDGQQVCNSALVESKLLNVCKKIVYEGTLHNDCDGNDVPDEWCGTVTSIDRDCDGRRDLDDNCPLISNPDQLNSDRDPTGDACDNCPYLINYDQENSDTDIYGDACDNCPYVTDPLQTDLNTNGVGDLCEKNVPLNGRCITPWNCVDPLSCGPAGTCIDFCVELGICPDPCQGITCPQGQGCSGGICIDECGTALDYYLQYDKNKIAINDGDILTYLFNSRNRQFKPSDEIISLTQDGKQPFNINIEGITYTVNVNEIYDKLTDSLKLKILSLDKENGVMNIKLGCNLGQPITYVSGGCSSDIIKQCLGGTQALQYSCVNNNLQPVLEQCPEISSITCDNALDVNIKYDNDPQILNDGDTLRYTFDSRIFTLKPSDDVPQVAQDGTQQFNIFSGPNIFTAVVGSDPVQVDGGLLLKVNNLDKTNKIIGLKLGCGNVQTPVIDTGCVQDVTEQCLDGSTVETYNCINGNLEKTDLDCQSTAVAINNKPECSTAGVVCPLENCVSSDGGFEIDTSYKEQNCCVPVISGEFTVCFETNVLVDGTVLRVGRGQCIDDDGDGDGQRQVQIEDSEGNPISDNGQLESLGYPQQTFSEECRVKPQTVTTAPYYTFISLILSLLLIGIYYTKKYKFE